MAKVPIKITVEGPGMVVNDIADVITAALGSVKAEPSITVVNVHPEAPKPEAQEDLSLFDITIKVVHHPWGG